ncbi:MAG: hypothetical protein WC840_00705 [Candidatus Peribacteraceae bacterium]
MSLFVPLTFGLLFLASGLVVVRLSCFQNKRKPKNWVQVMITTIPLLFGLSAFFLQSSFSNWQIKNGLKQAVIEELQMITLQLQGGNGVMVGNDEKSGTSLKINAVTLPSVAIERASESNLFNRFLTRDLLLLRSFIVEHNRWADYGMDILRSPNLETVVQRIKIHNNYMTIDDQIVPKATYLLDCITKGTSSLDKDCK